MNGVMDSDGLSLGYPKGIQICTWNDEEFCSCTKFLNTLQYLTCDRNQI